MGRECSTHGRNENIILVGKLGRPRNSCEYNLKTYFKEIGYGCMDWIGEFLEC
jgi:hypothetical protein